MREGDAGFLASLVRAEPPTRCSTTSVTTAQASATDTCISHVRSVMLERSGREALHSPTWCYPLPDYPRPPVEVVAGLDRIVALSYCLSTLHRNRQHIRCLYF